MPSRRRAQSCRRNRYLPQSDNPNTIRCRRDGLLASWAVQTLPCNSRDFHMCRNGRWSRRTPRPRSWRSTHSCPAPHMGRCLTASRLWTWTVPDHVARPAPRRKRSTRRGPPRRGTARPGGKLVPSVPARISRAPRRARTQGSTGQVRVQGSSEKRPRHRAWSKHEAVQERRMPRTRSRISPSRSVVWWEGARCGSLWRSGKG